jgi:hypothetical protein
MALKEEGRHQKLVQPGVKNTTLMLLRPGLSGALGGLVISGEGVLLGAHFWLLTTSPVDNSNPPESAVPALEADPYYRRVTFVLLPRLGGAFIYAAWFSQTAALSLPAHLGLILATGGVGSFCINLGPEIGHKPTPFEKWLAKLILAPTLRRAARPGPNQLCPRTARASDGQVPAR